MKEKGSAHLYLGPARPSTSEVKVKEIFSVISYSSKWRCDLGADWSKLSRATKTSPLSLTCSLTYSPLSCIPVSKRESGERASFAGA